MRDIRERELAKLLVDYSVELKQGESCLINAVDVPIPMIEELIQAVYEAGGYPQVNTTNNRIERALVAGSSKESLDLWADCDAYRMKKMDAFIGIRGIMNTRETVDIPERYASYMKYYSDPVHHKIRVPHTKWVVLRYPTPSMAQMADMSTEAFEDYYFNVCNLDYSKMEKAMRPLKALMERSDRVLIKGPGTELSFSIKNMPAIICAGHMNIPDGEIYTAPIKTSVNGVITYNTPSVHDGFTYTDIRLTFKDGRLYEAKANNTERINKVFEIDEGARFIGEFALGVNPFITAPMKDTLFDEKITGSFHFTPGSSYDDAFNGNKSALHWDLVCIQTPEYGGGEIWFDDVLVRRDGAFVLDELLPLNPEQLKQN